MKKPLIIITATQEELSGIERLIDRPDMLEIGGRRVIRGYFKDQAVWLIVSGVGVVNTAQALTAVIEHQQPACVLQVGIAGAFGQAGLTVGDIGIAEVEIDPYLGIEKSAQDGAAIQALPFTIVGKCKNRYRLNARLSAQALDVVRRMYSGSGVGTDLGPFLTVNRITATDATAQHLYDDFKPIMENMEGCATAHVCRHYDIPCLEIRAASNLVGLRQRELWRVDLALERLSETVGQVIAELLLMEL